MPFKIKALWIGSCVFIFAAFIFLSMQRSIAERREEAQSVAAKRSEEIARKKQIEAFKEKAFQEAGEQLKELVAMGKFDDVAREAGEILAKNPENAPAYAWWGVALVKSGKMEESIEKFEKASQLDQNNARTYIYWGLALSMLGKYDESMLKFRTSLQIDPQNSNAYAYWAGALANQENHAEAIKKLNTSLEIDPANPLALELLVDEYYRTKQYDQAWSAVRQARKEKVELKEATLKRLSSVMPEPAQQAPTE